jgi:hypothetical protein
VATQPTSSNLWERGQRGWPARFPLLQFPNPPLVAALAGWLVAELTDGSVHSYARTVFYAGLAVWAYGELAGGVNWVRRVVGAAGLVYVVIKVGGALDQ